MTTIEINDVATAPAAPIELEDAPAALSIQMQTYAQGYIDARKRAGLAWLDMGRFLVEARQAAKHGEWGVFLQATNTSQDTADRLMAIYQQSVTDRRFADAVRTNVLSVSAAYELTTAPPDVRDRLLTSEAPITRTQIRDEKRVANSAPARSLEVRPAPVAALVAERETDLPTEFAVIKRRFAAHEILLTCKTGEYIVLDPSGAESRTRVWDQVLDRLSLLEEGAEEDDEPPAAPAAPARLMCPTCGAPILNGIWGDLKECGACYQKRQRVRLAVPPRPRRPVSADVSDTVKYIHELEAYCGALEDCIMTLQKQIG